MSFRDAAPSPRARPEPDGGPPDVLELPFDQYQRYRLVADVVERLSASGDEQRVLDVGGRTALLRRFLPSHAVTLVDYEPSEERGLVLGDGSRLPFRERCFDAVTACDTLEHVPPERRADFVRECCRVSRGAVVLAGPYRLPRVDEAEETLVELLREKLGTRHRYLEEHRSLGLPVLADVQRVMEECGAQVAVIGHGNLDRWLGLMSLALYMDEEPQLRKVARRYFRFYNQALYQADFEPPHYRHVVIGWLRGEPLAPRIGEIAAPRSASPATRPFAELLLELVALDRERDLFQAERARLTEVNEGLVRDLAGHRGTIAELREELRSQADAIEALRAELERERRAGAETAETLARDLDGHRRALVELAAGAADLEARLDGANRRVGELDARLGELNAENENLRARLRSRLENLRRAFALRKPPI